MEKYVWKSMAKTETNWSVYRDVTGQESREKVSKKKKVGQVKSGRMCAKSVKFSILTKIYFCPFVVIETLRR